MRVILSEPDPPLPDSERVRMARAERRGAALAAAYAAAIDRFAELAGLGLPNVIGVECQKAATRAWEDVMRTTREVERG